MDQGGPPVLQLPWVHDLGVYANHYYSSATRCVSFRPLSERKVMVAVNPASAPLRNGERLENYMHLVGDAVGYRHLRLISLFLAVLAEPAPRDEAWLSRLATAGGLLYERIVQLRAAVYAHSQVFAHVMHGQVSASTHTGMYRWAMGAPPDWVDAASATSFSKLDIFRTRATSSTMICTSPQCSSPSLGR